VGYACDTQERELIKKVMAEINQMVHIAPDLPFRLDIPIAGACQNCGGPIVIQPGFEVTIDLDIGAAVYARVLDSQGNVVAENISDQAGSLRIDFDPASISLLAPAGVLHAPISFRDDLPHDATAYTLEIIPLEDPNGDRSYDLSLTVSQGFQVYLPMTVR
jgi:hypothetical protein